jgi:hypothetical protein
MTAAEVGRSPMCHRSNDLAGVFYELTKEDFIMLRIQGTYNFVWRNNRKKFHDGARSFKFIYPLLRSLAESYGLCSPTQKCLSLTNDTAVNSSVNETAKRFFP